jgi:EAL domain-containing protein (putative c-di-GMP-specific phosphodiesterase class I)
VEELLKRAELALYQAKSAGRDSLQFFDPSMQQAVSARVEMEKDIRLALERHEFDLFYQPQVCNGQVMGAEALLRWQHPSKGLISPAVFVPAAEDSGLILPLGEWALYAACRQLARWARDPALSQMSMSVNVSPRQFYQPDFVAQVQQALEVTGARAERLELELTEGMLLEDVEDTIRKMVQLKALGVSFSLDDFGTGYSSLSYLKRLPLDKLKIDQGFVREVVTSSNDAAIARSIIALGHSLGLQVIAEGVETEAQRAFLEENGCNFWQGYLFSRPQPVADFEAWARSYNAETTNLQAT